MSILQALRHHIESESKESNPELIKAYALLRLAIAVEEIGVHAFGTDALQNPSDRRSAFERLAGDIPQSLSEIADAIKERE